MSKAKAEMTNEIQNPSDVEYDLEERTAKFGEDVIEFVKKLKKNAVNNLLIGQVVRSATSIGANYMEADAAVTKKDFVYKIGLCRKEAKETKHWLRMVAKAAPKHKEPCRKLWQGAQELTLVFSSIVLTSKRRS